MTQQERLDHMMKRLGISIQLDSASIPKSGMITVTLSDKGGVQIQEDASEFPSETLLAQLTLIYK
jgi:hypothetical protein